MDLTGKVAVITGAARGIGKVYARALLQKGCKVCMSDIDVEKGTKTCSEAQTEFGFDNVIFVKCDVTSEVEVKGLMKAAVDNFGFVDIMVNNAGIVNEGQPFSCVDVNLNGVIRGMTVAMDVMRQDKGGRGGTIVNMSSIAVFSPFNFLPAYTAAKWGIVGYSKSWAAHPEVVNNGIRIICICPTGVNTEILNFNENTVKGLHLWEEVKTVMAMMDEEDMAKSLLKVLEDKGNHGCCLKVENWPDSQMKMTYV